MTSLTTRGRVWLGLPSRWRWRLVAPVGGGVMPASLRRVIDPESRQQGNGVAAHGRVTSPLRVALCRNRNPSSGNVETQLDAGVWTIARFSPIASMLQSASMLERRSLSWPAAATLFLILVVAGLLRFWGIDYGLPHPTTRPDEEMIVGRAFAILSHRLKCRRPCLPVVFHC